MNALSRREEETLLKTTKARALKECDPVVKGLFSGSPLVRTSTHYLKILHNVRRVVPCRWHGHVKINSNWSRIVWFGCMLAPFLFLSMEADFRFLFSISTGPEPMEKVRQEYLRLRNQQRDEQQSQQLAAETVPPS